MASAVAPARPSSTPEVEPGAVQHVRAAGVGGDPGAVEGDRGGVAAVGADAVDRLDDLAEAGGLEVERRGWVGGRGDRVREVGEVHHVPSRL